MEIQVVKPVYRYSVFGLNIQSNRELQTLEPDVTHGQVDVIIDFIGDQPACRLGQNETHLYPRDTQAYSVFNVWRNESGGLRVLAAHEKEYACFMIDGKGSRIDVACHDGAPMKDISLYLLGPVLGAVLRLKGTLCLHGSAVAVDENRAIALLGPKGSGKSTTAAKLAAMGHTVMTDDIVAIRRLDEGYSVSSGYPGLRLRRSAVNGLFGDEDALPRLWSDVENRSILDRRFLDLRESTYSYSREPKVLSSIFILGPRSVRITEPELKPLGRMEAMFALAANSFADYILDGKGRKLEWQDLNHLINEVPVFSVSRPEGLDSLESICRKLTGEPAMVS